MRNLEQTRLRSKPMNQLEYFLHSKSWLIYIITAGLLFLPMHAALFNDSTSIVPTHIETDKNKTVQNSGLSLIRLEEKVANLTRAIRYRPFQLPQYYNRLQIPNFSFIHARSLETPGFMSEKEISASEASGNLAQQIKTKLKVKYITEVNELNEEITFAADLILHWNDPLIYVNTLREFKFTEPEAYALTSELTNKLYKTLDSDIMTQIWKPDIFIENTVKIDYPELMSKPLTVRLNELVGEVIYTARLRVQMECEMDFHYYPADTQNCEVLLRSNSYSKEELQMIWVDETSASLDYCGGAGFDYQIAGVSNVDESEGYINNLTRQFSGLRFSILARRKLSYHIVQTFLPSVFFIVITWLRFLLPSVEARIGVAMTSLLTLTAMFASVREDSPKVTYVRAIDIWMLACVIFVFLTLLEFTTILWTRHKKYRTCCTHDSNYDKNAVVLKIHEDENEATETNLLKLENETKKEEICRIKFNFIEFIEGNALLFFSFIFTIFCTLYWVWLITQSGYLVWNIDGRFNCAGDIADAKINSKI